MIKFLIIALFAYLVLKYIGASLRRSFTAYQNPSEPTARVEAVETVKCPRCGTFVAEGTAHECVT